MEAMAASERGLRFGPRRGHVRHVNNAVMAAVVLLLVTCATGVKAQDEDLQETLQRFNEAMAGMAGPGEDAESSGRDLLASTGRPKLLGSGLFNIPHGLVQIIRTQPGGAELFKHTDTTSSAPSSTPIAIRTTVNPDGTPVDPLQQAVDNAAVGVVSAAFLLTSSILFTVSGALGTTAASIGIAASEWAKDSGRVQFVLSELAVAQTLYTDFNSQIDNSDVLGDVAKYIKLWNKIRQPLASGALLSDINAQIGQLGTAGGVIKAVSNSVKRANVPRLVAVGGRNGAHQELASEADILGVETENDADLSRSSSVCYM